MVIAYTYTYIGLSELPKALKIRIDGLSGVVPISMLFCVILDR